MPAQIPYEVPAHVHATDRHGPYFVIPRERGVRITGTSRMLWGAWRRIALTTAAVGLFLFLAGSIYNALLGKPVVIDLRTWPPTVQGLLAAVGLLLLFLTALAWLIHRAFTLRSFHRLEIDAGPEELLIRHEPPAGEQVARRWPTQEIESVTADQYLLIIRPRGEQPFRLPIGGPATSAYWLADQLRAALGLPTGDRMNIYPS